jgi:hypothetical protein
VNSENATIIMPWTSRIDVRRWSKKRGLDGMKIHPPKPPQIKSIGGKIPEQD